MPLIANNCMQCMTREKTALPYVCTQDQTGIYKCIVVTCTLTGSLIYARVRCDVSFSVKQHDEARVRFLA